MANENKVSVTYGDEKAVFKSADGKEIPLAGGPDSPESKVNLIVLEGEARFGTPDNPIIIPKAEPKGE